MYHKYKVYWGSDYILCTAISYSFATSTINFIKGIIICRKLTNELYYIFTLLVLWFASKISIVVDGKNLLKNNNWFVPSFHHVADMFCPTSRSCDYWI